MQPTLAGFLTFIRNVMGISTTILPDSSPVIGMAFAVALAIANDALQTVAVPQFDSTGASLNSGGYSIYAFMVYNLAADNLINYAGLAWCCGCAGQRRSWTSVLPVVAPAMEHQRLRVGRHFGIERRINRAIDGCAGSSKAIHAEGLAEPKNPVGSRLSGICSELRTDHLGPDLKGNDDVRGPLYLQRLNPVLRHHSVDQRPGTSAAEVDPTRVPGTPGGGGRADGGCGVRAA